jgi:hypothetical protein
VDGLQKVKKEEGQLTVPDADDVPIDKKLCELVDVDRSMVLAQLESLVRSAASAEAPVMPRTMWAGMSEVMEKSLKGKAIRSRATSSDLLGGDEFSRADADDQRARVFIPEKFDFDGFNSAIDKLLGAGAGIPSRWTYRGSRDINRYLKPFKDVQSQEIKERERQEKQRLRELEAARKQQEKDALKAEKAAEKAAKKAESDAEKPAKSNATKAPKKVKGDADQPDPN